MNTLKYVLYSYLHDLILTGHESFLPSSCALWPTRFGSPWLKLALQPCGP